MPLAIMLTDDEKFFHSAKLTLEDCHRFALQNAADIIAIGFDPNKTFMFIDTDFVDGGSGAAFNYNVRVLGKRTTINQIKGTFGFGDRYFTATVFDLSLNQIVTTLPSLGFQPCSLLQLSQPHILSYLVKTRKW